jgi:DNA-binding CsgD family transcriptional regulator
MSSTVQMHRGWLAPHPRTKKYAEPPLAAAPRDPEFAARWQRLTRLERNILRSRAEGVATAAIGRRYGISSQTVINTLTFAIRKLAVGGMGKSLHACYLLGRYDADADGAMG